MIAGEALAAWLEDERAQAETAGRIENVARELRRLPLLARLQDELEEAQRGGVEAVLALARRAISNPAFTRTILEMLLSAAKEDPFFRPHHRVAANDVHSGLLLLEQPALTVSFATMSADAIAAKRAERRGGASLIFTGQRSLFHFVKGGGAILSFWAAPPIEPGFTAETSGRCRFVERRAIEDGETIEIDGRRLTFIVEEAAHDLVLFQATTTLGAGTLNAEYDSSTLRFIAASSTDEASSRTQMMLTFLRIMDRQDSVPLFREMLRSEYFYARWQVMREFLALDAEAALPHLREMAESDPHSEVREAAARTLSCFFPEPSHTEEEIACPA